MSSSSILLHLALGLAAVTPGSPPASSGSGDTLLTVEEALELAFEDCDVVRTRAYLKKEHKARVGELAGEKKFSKGIVFPYVAKKEGELVGTAYFDTHEVRTKRETVMIVVDPKGKIARIEVLAFAEPREYLPRAKWYAQFVGRALDRDLNLKRGIKGVSGATLTARSTTGAARRTLAIHRVLAEIEAERKREKTDPPKSEGPKDSTP